MTEVYVSTDVETDGPIPGPHSVCSLASAAYLAEKTLMGPFTANLELVPGATSHPDRMTWWKSHPEAWCMCRVEPRPPEEAMREYVDWLESLPGTPLFVTYALEFDFTFIYWYLMRFGGRSRFWHHGIDIRTYARAMMKRGTRRPPTIATRSAA